MVKRYLHFPVKYPSPLEIGQDKCEKCYCCSVCQKSCLCSIDCSNPESIFQLLSKEITPKFKEAIVYIEEMKKEEGMEEKGSSDESSGESVDSNTDSSDTDSEVL